MRTIVSHVAVLLVGIGTGAALTVQVARTWPRIEMAPAVVGASGLEFGTDSAGEPALCDPQGRALHISNEIVGRLSIKVDKIERDDGILSMTSRRCIPDKRVARWNGETSDGTVVPFRSAQNGK